MPSYKLYDSDNTELAELFRLLFALAGEKYEDIRLTKDEWEQFKPKTPTGTMPCLEIDGKMFSQSIALANYLARQFGYYPTDNFEALQVDEIIGIISDVMEQASKAFLGPDAEKEEAFKEFKANQMPKFLAILEKKIGPSGYYVGDKVTLADIAVFDLIVMGSEEDNILEGFDKLAQFKGKMSEVPQVKDWMEKMPKHL